MYVGIGVLNNVIKFTKEGNIIIAIQRNKEGSSGCSNHNNNNCDEAIACAKNTAARIDPEILPRMFTKC